MRLLSTMVAEPINKTSDALIAYYEKHAHCSVGDALDELTAQGHSQADANNAFWSLIAKSILQPVQLGDIDRKDKLIYKKFR